MTTAYFREADSGPLHSAQGAAARVLEPFQIGAERVVRPFRDAWGWFDGLRTARSENAQLKKDLAALRKQKVAKALAAGTPLHVAHYASAPRYVGSDYTMLKADVISDLPSYQQQVVVSAGTSDGVERYDPVVSTSGWLLGHISKVSSGSSQVTLINDRSSAVAVDDFAQGTKGILRGGGPDTGSLIMDQVSKQDFVAANDIVTTAGRLSGGSFYPQGILVGKIDSVTQSDTNPFKSVTIKPFANLDSIDQVVILLRKGRVPQLP